MHSDRVRQHYKIDGTGITVAVVANSFNCTGGAAKGIAQGELPNDVLVLKDSIDCSRDDDEGRAMLEIVHDIAPGAKLVFHTMGSNVAEFSQAVVNVANAGANIIVDDTLFFQEPMFQDGLAATTIDELVEKHGIAYFSSAGNSGNNSYQAAFVSSQSFPFGKLNGEAHDFDTRPNIIDTCQTVTMGADAITLVGLQWDQPIKAPNNLPGSVIDLDIVFYDNTSCKPPASQHSFGGSISNLGGDPIEMAVYNNKDNKNRVHIGIQILHKAGSKPTIMKYILNGSSKKSEHPDIDEYQTPEFSSTLFGHANAANVMAVAAMDYASSNNIGKKLQTTYYSSVGGTPIYFDSQGQRLEKPLIRNHPDITAPTNVNTSFFGSARQDIEADGIPNFTGTSAAAPHVAGVAALLLQTAAQQRRVLKPFELYDILKRSSLPMSTDEHHNQAGYGLIQADRAIKLLKD